jgi:hypothetical protein
MLRQLLVAVSGMVLLGSAVVAQGLIDRFASDEKLSHGTVVVQDERTITPASIDSNSTLLGVVRDDNSLQLFSISNDGQQLDVMTSGISEILVSTQNGPIKTGDQLSPSRLAGVATASAGQTVLLGTALDDFDGRDSLVEVTLQDSNQPVDVGRIRARIDIRRTSGGNTVGTKAPAFVQTIADNIAGKQVAPIRAVSSFMIVIGTLLLSGSLFITLETGAHDSKQRNPDSTRVVRRSESQLLLIVLGVTALGLGLAYLLLRTA